MAKALFLDRDGVINFDTGFVHREQDFVFMPRVIEGLKVWQRAGFLLIVVTNQSGVARGFFSEHTYLAFQTYVEQALYKRGVFVAKTYYCPHHADAVIPEYRLLCNCRKPAPGMLLQARLDFDISMKDSVLLGDKLSDIQAAKDAGVGKYFLVGDRVVDASGLQAFSDVLACAQACLYSCTSTPELMKGSA